MPWLELWLCGSPATPASNYNPKKYPWGKITLNWCVQVHVSVMVLSLLMWLWNKLATCSGWTGATPTYHMLNEGFIYTASLVVQWLALLSHSCTHQHQADPSRPTTQDLHHITLTWSANVHCSSFALLSSLAQATDDNSAMHFCYTSSVLSLLSCRHFIPPTTLAGVGREKHNNKIQKHERERLSPRGNLYHDEWSGCQRDNNNTCETRRKIWATRTPCGDNAMDCEIHILIMTGILSPLAVICSSLTRGLVCIMSSKCE